MPFRERVERGLKELTGDFWVLLSRQGPESTSVKSKGAKKLARVLKPIAHIYGPMKEVADLYIEFNYEYEMAEAARVDYAMLQVQIDGQFKDLASFLGRTASLTLTESMEGICASIQAELGVVQSSLEKNTGARYIDMPDEVEVILGCYRRIHWHLGRLSLITKLEKWKMAEEQPSISRSDRLTSPMDLLSSSLSACYNSAEGAELGRRGCTPGTRLNDLALIHGWIKSSGGKSVYWLTGVADTGKTTIAYSICDRLTIERKLAASFFCSRLSVESQKVNSILPSIAYQLAGFSSSFMSALSETVKQDLDVHTSRLGFQFEQLIVKPLKRARNTLPSGLIIVIDGLDECEDKDGTRRMLKLLLSQAGSLPIRFIISSRPIPEIRDELSVRSQLVVLHELSNDGVQAADIKKYLREGLSRLSPSDAQIDALAEKGGNSFIYAVTAVRYIGYDTFKRNPNGRLSTILNRSLEQTTTESTELDQLYMMILEAEFGKRELEGEDLFDMQQALFTVICARESMTVQTISELLKIHDVDRVRAALRSLCQWGVLQVVEASDLVITLDTSFPDFMFDSSRSLKYHCDKAAHHAKLAELCFDCIKRSQARFNICGLESSYVFDQRLPNIESRVGGEVPLELLYACRYWAAHVDTANCASSVVDQLGDFLSTRLLLWMEVLNLNKQIEAGTECMRLAVDWCKALQNERELTDLAEDAMHFVETFASNPVSRSTPHIYISMLAFWPRSSPIARYYAKYTRGPVEPEGTALHRHYPGLLSMWRYEKGIEALAVSPNGSYIALAPGEEVVVMAHSSNCLRQLQLLRGHTCTVYWIVCSPDGTRIFSASSGGYNATILGWDMRSGEAILGPLQLSGHTGTIGCIGFSFDCTRIATGSADKTARLWDAETGKMLHSWPTNHGVYAVTFLPDGTQVVVGSGHTLQVWDTNTGNIILGPISHPHAFFGVEIIPGQLHFLSTGGYHKTMHVWDPQTGEIKLGPIKGHTSRISTFRCSPNGKYIVSGSSDGEVCVWDVQTGKMVIGPLEAHTRVVTSVSFTPDGSRIISACMSGLVCTWDTQQQTYATTSPNPPADQIRCVKFVPDGTCFVSGSYEGKICIWDAYTGEMRVDPIKAHTSGIYAVAVWKDRVVSGASDGTICICDVLTGEVVLGPLKVFSGSRVIWSIAYSPDGQIIATGSWHGVDGWNAQSGERVFAPLIGLEGLVESVEFSPDGTRIVGCSWGDRSNIAVWDVSTGKSVFGTLDGHGRDVNSVSYSPNGTLIASGSDDKTIIVWDAYTAKKRLGPLTGHSDRVRSVHFSPDSTRLVSGSRDRTILIWDVQTGEMMFQLPNGHEVSIMSVEYSPGGTRILSRSDDGDVRIHDARSPAEKARARSESEIGDWTMNKDGWVVDDQSRLLVWVPKELRKALPSSSTLLARPAPQDYLRLKFDKSRMGESWAEGYKSGM